MIPVLEIDKGLFGLLEELGLLLKRVDGVSHCLTASTSRRCAEHFPVDRAGDGSNGLFGLRELFSYAFSQFWMALF